MSDAARSRGRVELHNLELILMRLLNLHTALFVHNIPDQPGVRKDIKKRTNANMGFGFEKPHSSNKYCSPKIWTLECNV